VSDTFLARRAKAARSRRATPANAGKVSDTVLAPVIVGAVTPAGARRVGYVAGLAAFAVL